MQNPRFILPKFQTVTTVDLTETTDDTIKSDETVLPAMPPMPPAVVPQNNSNLQVDVFRLNILELPELIFVETRFVTKQAAKQCRLENLYYLNDELKEDAAALTQSMLLTTNPTFVPLNQPIMALLPMQMCPAQSASVSSSAIQPAKAPSTTATVATAIFTPTVSLAACNANNVSVSSSNSNNFSNITVSLRVAQSDAETMTESPAPCRERAQQTEDVSSTNITVAIQCNRDADDDQDEWETLVSSRPTTKYVNVRTEFERFVSEKTEKHANGRYECLLCGEIAANVRNLQFHMALHWGPPVLCCQCGLKLEHKALLRHHLCERGKKGRLRVRARLRCPHFRCGVMAISPLELYDHINEHTCTRTHVCSVCGSSYCTAGEFLRHLLRRAKCYMGAKRRRTLTYSLVTRRERECRVRVFTLYSGRKRTMLVKSFLSQRLISKGSCQICLKRCRNAFAFGRHTIRCLRKHRARLEKRRTRRNASD